MEDELEDTDRIGKSQKLAASQSVSSLIALDGVSGSSFKTSSQQEEGTQIGKVVDAYFHM